VGGNKNNPTSTPTAVASVTTAPASVASVTNTPATGVTATANTNNPPTPTQATRIPTPTVGNNSGGIPAGWSEINSPESGFSITMPNNPTKDTTPSGNIDVVYYQSNVNNNNVSYTASYANYTANATGNDADTFLKAVLQGQESSLNATNIRDEKVITLGSVPGRQATYDITQGGIKGVAVSRAYLSESRLYQLLVIYTSTQKPSDNELNTFFNSFKITE
jgi:hypothetical protein